MYYGDRKSGCRFCEVIYRGFKTLIVENSKIRFMILVEKGTDIVSFVYKPCDTEFVWTNPMGLSCLDRLQVAPYDTDIYNDDYVGGWFEITPNAGGTLTHRGQHFYGHSETTHLPWDYRVITDSEELLELEFYVRLGRYPFFITKRLRLENDSARIDISEKIENVGDIDLEYLYAYHPSVGMPFLDENCVIEAPFLEKSINVPPVKSGVQTFNIYTNIKEAFGRIRNTKTGLSFNLEWTKETLPSCAVWVDACNNCGINALGGRYVVCFLPYNSDRFGLDAAAKAHTAPTLKAHETVEIGYSVYITSDDK